MSSPLALKKHRAARRRVSEQIQTFYRRAFPGQISAPDVFWVFIREKESELGAALEDAAENGSRIQRACVTFVDLFKKACIRGRQLIDDGKQTGDDGSEGGKASGGEAARQALEDAERPEAYWLWGGRLR